MLKNDRYIPMIGDRVWAYSSPYGEYAEAQVTGSDPSTCKAFVRTVLAGILLDESEHQFNQLVPISEPKPTCSWIESGPLDLAERAASVKTDSNAPPKSVILVDKPTWGLRNGDRWHLNWMEMAMPEMKIKVMTLDLSTPESWATAYRFMRAVKAINWEERTDISNIDDPYFPNVEVLY